jgi:hypothetical protein
MTKKNSKGVSWLNPETKQMAEWTPLEETPENLPTVAPEGKVYQGEDGIKKMLYDERKATVDYYWDLYKKTADKHGNGDLEALAVICERMPFFENSLVGQEIARRLRGSTDFKRGNKKGFRRKITNEKVLRENKALKKYAPDWQKQARARFLLKLFPELTYRAIYDLID